MSGVGLVRRSNCSAGLWVPTPMSTRWGLCFTRCWPARLYFLAAHLKRLLSSISTPPSHCSAGGALTYPPASIASLPTLWPRILRSVFTNLACLPTPTTALSTPTTSHAYRLSSMHRPTSRISSRLPSQRHSQACSSPKAAGVAIGQPPSTAIMAHNAQRLRQRFLMTCLASRKRVPSRRLKLHDPPTSDSYTLSPHDALPTPLPFTVSISMPLIAP